MVYRAREININHYNNKNDSNKERDILQAKNDQLIARRVKKRRPRNDRFPLCTPHNRAQK